MKGMFPLGTVLLAAASIFIDPGLCRQSTAGKTGPSAWATDGRNHLSVSMDARSTGEVSLRCRVESPADADAVTIEFDRALISFQPAGSKATGSGLTLSANSCHESLVRVAGEDWIEAPHRSWTVKLDPHRREFELRLAVTDNSDRDPVRVDLWGLRVTPGNREDADFCTSVGQLPAADLR